ncbi:MAG TPA: DMT family transporter [Steroidobacteraceae bacterium]
MADVQDATLDRAGLTSGLIAALSWGMTGTFIHLVTTASPGLITVCRLAVSALVLTAIAMIRRGNARRPAPPRMAIAAIAAYYVFATEAFTRAPVVEVTLLVGSSPLIAVCFVRFMGRPVSPLRLVGVVVAVVGLAGFVIPGSRYSFTSIIGDVLALAAAIVSAIYVTLLRAAASAGNAPDGVAVAARASIVGAIASVALLAIRGAGSISTVSIHDWWVLISLGAISTAIPTVAYSEASRRLPTTVTTSLTLLTPLFAALFAGFLLGEWPIAARLPGAIVAFAGICIVVLRQ